ncbi:RNA-binding protein, partial [Akkermansiaceae bacterium]|nr:RNA-binding protein [Akkermansiaceae bacterium]
HPGVAITPKESLLLDNDIDSTESESEGLDTLALDNYDNHKNVDVDVDVDVDDDVDANANDNNVELFDENITEWVVEDDFEDYCSPRRKIFIENIPDDIDENGIANVLRNCGQVSRVWLHRANDDEKFKFRGLGRRTKHFSKKYEREFRADEDDNNDDDDDDDDDDDEVDEDEEFQRKQEAKNKRMMKKESLLYNNSNGNDFHKGNASKSVTANVDANIADLDYHINNMDDAKTYNDDDDDDDEEDEWSDTLGISGLSADNTKEKSNYPLLTNIIKDNKSGKITDLNVIRENILKKERSKEQIKFEKKALTLKKRVARTHRNYSYAYVLMENDFSYNRITRDEMRIFGVCIDGYSCRIQEASRLRTLIVEFDKPVTCDDSRSQIAAILGPWYTLNLPQLNNIRSNVKRQLQWSDVANKKPVFIHLEFDTHDEAWKSHDVLTRAAKYSNANIKVNWVKSKLYWKVACKARELNVLTKSSKKVSGGVGTVGGPMLGEGNTKHLIENMTSKELRSATKSGDVAGMSTLEEDLKAFS